MSTLTVHADNLIGMETDDKWFWTWKPDTILAIEVNGRVYNIKDVQSIKREQNELMIVQLVTGEQLKAQRKDFGWLNCSTSKACSPPIDIVSGSYTVNLDGRLKSMRKDELANPASIKWGRTNQQADPRNAMMDDYRATPRFDRVGARIVVLEGVRLSALNSRVATVIKEWDDKAPERKARDERASREYREVAQRQQDKLRNASIGTPAYCERAYQGDLPPTVTLECPDYGILTMNDFRNAGWNVVTVNTTPIVDSIGNPFTQYRVSFQKVR